MKKLNSESKAGTQALVEVRQTRGKPWFPGFCTMLAWVLSVFPLLPSARAAAPGILEIRNGYFWDNQAGEYFVPRGFAHQTWNPPVYANQSPEQIEYDLIEFKKMHANSVRVDLVWGELERKPGEYDWRKPDALFQKAEELGIKLFVLIGYQYPPGWFPSALRGFNDHGLISNVINYENPEAQRAYTNHIGEVTRRYKDNRAVAGWIVGNEYAYFDLWEPIPQGEPHPMIGYDPISTESFKKYVTAINQGDIATLNQKWGTDLKSFDEVVMPQGFPADRHDPAYHDLLQWRKKSIGDFVGMGAAAAKQNDTNHLITYSMIGLVFSEDDDNNTCEDAKTIVTACRQAGAPLDFWSINNYAWSRVGSELRTADFGVAKYQSQAGLPILITETGHTETETFWGGADVRHPKTVPSQLWEALMSGAIGVHLFHWSDRDAYVGKFSREKGFGIVQQNRIPKQPVYENVREFFRRLETIKIDHLLGGSTNPPTDLQFLWSVSGDMGWPRANYENANIWGALRRLGYQPGIMDDDDFDRQTYTNAAALILSRTYQMNPAHLRAVEEKMIPAGIHIYANTDLPGQYNAYHQPNPDWLRAMASIFGIDATHANPPLDGGISGAERAGTNHFTGSQPLGSLSAAYRETIKTWKIWHGVATTNSGRAIVTHTGLNGTSATNPIPALIVKNHGPAKTALNTFALGDTTVLNNVSTREWDFRSDWLRAIFRNHFGIVPPIELSGSAGARYVVADYRLCANGSVLVSLLNEHVASVSLTLSAPQWLIGKTIENLATGGIVEVNSDGRLNLSLAGDEFLLLYAYSSDGAIDQSLVNANPSKLWFQSEPDVIWPNENGYDVTVAYDTRSSAGVNLFTALERVGGQTYGAAAPVCVFGAGTNTFHIPVLGGNQNEFISSRKGAEYVWHAWIEKNGAKESETFMPVRLVWGARPVSVPPSVIAGNEYKVTVEWDELPSPKSGASFLPLNRGELWESVTTGIEYYNIVLELRSGAQTVVSNSVVTSQATSSHEFTIRVPSGAAGPFSWVAYPQPVEDLTNIDLPETFEGRPLGALAPRLILNTNALSYLKPWESYHYPVGGAQSWFDEGVALEDARGSYYAFVIITNPPPPLGFSGFGIRHLFNPERSIPENWTLWSGYHFSCDVKLKEFRNCAIELQVKNADPQGEGRWIQFSQPYQPGPDGWQTVSASLDQFAKPSWSFGEFDPAKIIEIVVNIVMFDANVVYECYFDNIQLDGPDVVNRVGAPFSMYNSLNVFQPPETGHLPGELLLNVSRNGAGEIVLGWYACVGQRYAIQYRDGGKWSAGQFQPVPDASNVTVQKDGVIEFVEAPANQATTRFYRLVVLP